MLIKILHPFLNGSIVLWTTGGSSNGDFSKNYYYYHYYYYYYYNKNKKWIKKTNKITHHKIPTRRPDLALMNKRKNLSSSGFCHSSRP